MELCLSVKNEKQTFDDTAPKGHKTALICYLLIGKLAQQQRSRVQAAYPHELSPCSVCPELLLVYLGGQAKCCNTAYVSIVGRSIPGCPPGINNFVGLCSNPHGAAQLLAFCGFCSSLHACVVRIVSYG